MTTPFSLDVVTGANNSSIVRLSGYLDAHTANELESSIQSLVDSGVVKIIVDFTSLDYISSAGLGVFMVFIEQVREAGGDLKLAAMPEKVFSVFDLLGFPLLFSILPTVAEAEAQFTS